MKYSVAWLPIFVLVLSPPGMAETHDESPLPLNRYQAPSSSARLSEMIGACLAGRPPVARPVAGPAFPGLVAPPQFGGPAVPPVSPEPPAEPEPPEEVLPEPPAEPEPPEEVLPEPHVGKICEPRACTMEYAPVTCEVKFTMSGDILESRTVGAGNQCFVLLKLCQLQDDDVDSIQGMDCKPGYVDEGLPKDKYYGDGSSKQGDRWDKPQYDIQMVRKKGTNEAMGDLVERDGKLFLNTGFDVMELDTSELSAKELKDLKAKTKLVSSKTGEFLGVKGDLSYIEDPRLKQTGRRKHYSDKEAQVARSDMYKLKVRSFGVYVE